MKKTRLAAVALIVGIVPVLLSGCIGTPAPVKTTAPAPAATSSVAPPAPVGVLPQPSTSAQLQEQNSLSGYAKVAAAAFPDATATAHFNKLQVQEALYSAREFASRSLNQPTFISGYWAQNGYNPDSATQMINYLTPLAYQHLKDLMTGVQQKDSAAENKLFSVLLWYPVGGTNYQVCGRTADTCQDLGYPKLSNYAVGENKSGDSLEITLTGESHVSMTVKGTKGYMPVTNTMTLKLVKNTDYKGGLAAQPFLINGWNTKYVSQSWTK